MPSKSKKQKPKTTNVQESAHESPRRTSKQVSTPVYISVVGVHTTLLAFISLFLPKTKQLQDLARYNSQSSPITSQDRPQDPFLDDLTRSPTITLLSLCAGVLIIQTWWASWLKSCWIDITFQGTEPDDLKQRYPSAGQKAKALAETYGTVFAASLALHLILVLFGAPISELVFKTYLLALLISTLAILPASYIYGFPTWSSNDAGSLAKRWTWVRLFAELSPRNTVERALVYPCVGAVFGSWIGIIPIALDWDRPWQAWPLTPAYGAIFGYIVSSILTVTFHAIVSPL